MDYSPMIWNALQENLDVGQAYPVVYTMTPQTIELFVGSVYNKLHDKILVALMENGEQYIAKNDGLGLALLFFGKGIKLPPTMLLKIAKDICQLGQRVARWIAPLHKQQGDLWYCKLYLDLTQEEETYQL